MKKSVVAIFYFLICVPLFAQHEKVLPFAYQVYGWVNFCPAHLVSDPEGCSSWMCSDDPHVENGCYQEETDFMLFPFCSLSPKLIAQHQMTQGFQKTPCIPGSKCDYGVCRRCQQRLIRSFTWHEEIVEETESCYRMAKIAKVLHKCNCITSFIDKNDPVFAEIVREWDFCHKPACFSGYFDKHMSRNFPKFQSFIHYCSENSGCTCYWSETQNFRKAVVDLIYDRFWIELLKGGVAFDSKTAISTDVMEKLLLYPQRKFLEQLVHCFFYSDLKKALKSFDRKVLYRDFGDFWLDNLVTQEEWDQFCRGILVDLRALFLDQYKNCYSQHPHPKIRAELRAIHEEYNQPISQKIDQGVQ